MKQLNWYQIFGKSNIPDGRTVEPTDDIQIWLNCADIWDKTYTTLAEVLADTDTLLALITSNNAVDYMVRSTTWAVAQSLVPVMTDNTHPYGECFASSYLDAGGENFPPYKAFDNDSATRWQSSTSEQAPTYARCGYHLLNRERISKAYIKGRTDTNSLFRVRASNDGVSWTDLTSEVTLNSSNSYSYTFDLGGETAYEYYEFYGRSSTNGWACQIYTAQFYSAPITADATAMTYIGLNNYASNTLLADSTWCNAICNSEYFESVLNVKVPTMTSNTTPSGECSVNSQYSGGYEAYKAFDNNASTQWVATTSAGAGTYIRYHFPQPTNCVSAFLKHYNNSVTRPKYKIQASNDGVTWVDVTSEITAPVSDAAEETVALNTNGLYSDYQVYFTYKTSSSAVGLTTLQFYGREDV